MSKFIFSRSRLEKLFSDNSLWSLLAANLLTVFFALWQDWDLILLMWVYWSQSVIIGGFNFLRMRNLKAFTTNGLKINGVRAKPTRKTQNSISWFFLLHYGLFHLVYLVFLLTSLAKVDLNIGVFAMVVVFFLNHWYSYFHNKEKDQACVPNIGTLMFLPYARIIPMHLTLILGMAFASFGLLFFLILKTLADMIMHVVEHRPCQKKTVELEVRL